MHYCLKRCLCLRENILTVTFFFSPPQRSWRKIWMLLFKPSSTGVGRLEFYNTSESSFISDQRKAGRQKTAESKVVRLSDCLSVVPAVKESCPSGCTAFYLKTMQYTYTFASMTSQDWLNAVSHLAFRVSLTSPLKHCNFLLFLFFFVMLFWER